MQAFWFGIIAVLWAGFFVLEGFDFGVGMLLPLVGRGRRPSAASRCAPIGPVWDGNEVWLLVAGGATFAAFPEWYASVFSGFYLAFALLLVGPDPARHRHRVPRQGGTPRGPQLVRRARSSSARSCRRCCSASRSPNFAPRRRA